MPYILFALHDYYGPEKAEAVAESWSSSIKGMIGIFSDVSTVRGSGRKNWHIISHCKNNTGFDSQERAFGRIGQEAEKRTGGETKCLMKNGSGS
jgi:hypothetical protein